MLVALLAACATRQPPALWTGPPPRVEVAPLEVASLDDGECTTEHAMAPGDTAPCVGVLIPGGGRYGLGAYLEHQRRDLALTPALELCEDGRALDRAHASDRYAEAWAAYQAAEREARLRRAAGALGFVGGVVLGLGTAIGVLWAADGL
jgi:hypothetical protein